MSRRTIVVVGGGIAGVVAAERLARHHTGQHVETGHVDIGHVDVVLVETEAALGQHATGRSAAVLSETSGPRVVCALARASRTFFTEPPPGFTDHPLTGPRGLLWIGRDGDGDALDTLAAVAASGVAPTARRLGVAQARRLIPELQPHAIAAGGVHEPDALSLDVDLLLSSYAASARRAGAILSLDERFVRATRRLGGGWHITTTTRSLDADIIVDAAGAWGDEVARRCGVEPLGLQPLRRTACLVPAPDAVAHWPLVMDIANRCYFEPETGGLLISPADEQLSEPLDVRAEEEDVAWAIEMVNDVTGLGIRSVRSTWAGLRTFTADRSPAVGPDPDTMDFIWFVGQGGAGIKTAPAMTDVLMASLGAEPWPSTLAELGVSLADVSPARFR